MILCYDRTCTDPIDLLILRKRPDPLFMNYNTINQNCENHFKSDMNIPGNVSYRGYDCYEMICNF